MQVAEVWLSLIAEDPEKNFTLPLKSSCAEFNIILFCRGDILRQLGNVGSDNVLLQGL